MLLRTCVNRPGLIHLIFVLSSSLAASSSVAQQATKVTVIVSSGGKHVPDAIVREQNVGGRTDSAGTVILELPQGKHTLRATKLGYVPDTVSFSTIALDTTVLIELAERVQVTAPVIVTAARTEQRIEDVPLRVEVLAGEDVDEKTAMRPGDLTQMVAEIPGARVQPGAPGTGGANLRVQGFRGQYTEFLTDGLPLTGTSEAGLSLVQIPPLDLAQVEIIKGASSALYGPTALGGVVNFVTRRPPPDGGRRVRDLLLSASAAGGIDGVAFAGDRLNDSWGYTVLGGAHRQSLREADSDGWADIVGSSRAELRPRLYWNGTDGSRLLLTTGISGDERRGGGISGGSAPLSGSDRLKSRHGDVGAVGRIALSSGTLADFRSSITGQSRDHRFPAGTREQDREVSSLGELSVTRIVQRAILVGGFAAQTDTYTNHSLTGFDFAFNTLSAFAQTTLAASDAISFSLTGRCDRHNLYGASCVPVAGALFRQRAGFSERVSAGLGAYAPTPFIDETQSIGFARLRPFTGALAPRLGYERARNAAVDLGYHIGGLDVNATAYASRIANPVILHELSTGPHAAELISASGSTRTRGLDVFAVFTGDPVSVTAFYGLLRARETVLTNDAGTTSAGREVPYNPTHRGGLDIAFDVEETGSRIAVESYYTGRQRTDEDPYRKLTPGFTTIELLVTQQVARQQFFLSIDNLTNVRQTNYGPLLLPVRSRLGRPTTGLWAPLEGRTIRAGIRASL
ncbi:MAG: TonB-dependent receptor [Gemmatimonadaceae bacterium]